MKIGTLSDELLSFILAVSNEPFRAFTNNCLHRVLKVSRKAHSLGLHTEVYFAWARTSRLFGRFYTYTPHFIPVIDGVEFDKFYISSWGVERIVKDKLFVTERIYNTPYPNVVYIALSLLAVTKKRFKYNMVLVLQYALLGLPVYMVIETLLLLYRRGWHYFQLLKGRGR